MIKKTAKFYKLVKLVEENKNQKDLCELHRKQLISYIIEKTDFKSKDFEGKAFLEELFLLGLKAEEIDELKAFAKITWKTFILERSLQLHIKNSTIPEFINELFKHSKFEKIYKKLIEFWKWLLKNVSFISETEHKAFKFWILKVFYNWNLERSCIGNYSYWGIKEILNFEF